MGYYDKVLDDLTGNVFPDCYSALKWLSEKFDEPTPDTLAQWEQGMECNIKSLNKKEYIVPGKNGKMFYLGGYLRFAVAQAIPDNWRIYKVSVNHQAFIW